MDLLEGESLIWQGRPSWRSMLVFYVKWGIPALIPAIATIVFDWQAAWGVTATVVLIVIILLAGWLQRIGTSYVVTNRRIMVRHGIMSRHERSAHIDRVQNVNMNQTLFERMLGVGTVDFDTAGTDEAESDFRFVGVSDPGGLRHRIDQEYRRNQDAATAMYPAAAPPPPAV